MFAILCIAFVCFDRIKAPCTFGSFILCSVFKGQSVYHVLRDNLIILPRLQLSVKHFLKLFFRKLFAINKPKRQLLYTIILTIACQQLFSIVFPDALGDNLNIVPSGQSSVNDFFNLFGLLKKYFRIYPLIATQVTPANTSEYNKRRTLPTRFGEGNCSSFYTMQHFQ